MTSNIALFSVLFLAVIVAVAFWRKCNIGILAIGPGNIPSGNLMTVVAVTLAVEMGANPLLFALVAKVAANGFTLSPITPAGILMDKLCTDAGYSASDFAIPSMVNLILWFCLLMVIFCIYYKVWKIKPALQTSASSTAVAQKMSKEQVITALGIVVMVIMVVGFSISVGLASLAVAAVLMALKTSDEKKALAKVPWGTLLLITGMGGLHDCFQLRKQRRRTKPSSSVFTSWATPSSVDLRGIFYDKQSTSHSLYDYSRRHFQRLILSGT